MYLSACMCVKMDALLMYYTYINKHKGVKMHRNIDDSFSVANSITPKGYYLYIPLYIASFVTFQISGEIKLD